MAKKALEGLKVLDIGNIIAGPWCSTIMADFGAEVIKVEMPGSGDMIRSMGRIKDMAKECTAYCPPNNYCHNWMPCLSCFCQS